MHRLAGLLAALTIVTAACTAAPAADATQAPQKTADFKQSQLDLAYSFFSDNSVHRPTTKALLTGALEAMKAEAKAAGGSADVATPDFSDTPETSLPDFKKFAAAAGQLAAKNPQVAADRWATAGITGMLKADPDCHTYFLDGKGGVINSRSERPTGTGPQIPSGGTVLQAPDSEQLQAKLLDGGIVYITWHAFRVDGTYKITDQVKAVLDKGVAAGAKAWLFDLRGNVGGNGDDVMAAWFLNGEPMLKVQVRTGNAGTRTAVQALRLPAAYQLPIAIILNDRGGSAPEVFTADLKENKRATVVGQKSVGCLGGTNSVPIGQNGALLYVVQQEFTGAVTGTKYNNIGITPDVPADDASAVSVASKLLLDKIAGR
jgi:hypothetical protein